MPSKCEITNFSCAVLPLAESKEEIFLNFLTEARIDFEKAASDYEDDVDNIQDEINSLSSKCLECPHNSKSIIKEGIKFLLENASNRK